MKVKESWEVAAEADQRLHQVSELAGRVSRGETMRLEMQRPGWGKTNRAAWVGKNRQISREMRRNSSQKSAPLLQRNAENPCFMVRSTVL